MASTPPRQPSSGAGQPKSGATGPRVASITNDRVKIEFNIEDVVNRLLQDMARHGGSPVASCGGCNGCSA